jgi:hypothetical protein
MLQGSNVGKAETHEIWQGQRTRFRDVAQRVAADVAVLGGVGKRADTDAVQDNPDDFLEWLLSGGHDIPNFSTEVVAGDAAPPARSLTASNRETMLAVFRRNPCATNFLLLACVPLSGKV